MLNKDQYNQDEYNSYYTQETEGAEIKGYNEDEGGFMKKALLFLGLVVLGIAGYFGFKTFTTPDEASNITKQRVVSNEEPIDNKVIETIENNKAKIDEVAQRTTQELEEQAKAVDQKIEKTVQEEVASQVQKQTQGNQEMSQKDISKIVSIVMNKMEKEKVETDKVDNDLLNALNNSDDEVVSIKPTETKITETKAIIEESKSVAEEKTEKVSTYNKVTVDENTKGENLTELSEQIKKLLNMAGETTAPTQTNSESLTKEVSVEKDNSTTTNYEDSISKEIKVRSNEMRIIVVKKGDTLNKIAKRAYGNSMSYQKIFDANPDILNQADKIYVGQKLRIPK